MSKMDEVREQMFAEEQALLPPNERVAGPDQEMCLEKDDGYSCTSAKNHEGDHVSCGTLGAVHHRWARKEQ